MLMQVNNVRTKEGTDAALKRAVAKASNEKDAVTANRTNETEASEECHGRQKRPRCKVFLYEHGDCLGKQRVISEGRWNFDGGFNDILTSYVAKRWNDRKNRYEADGWCHAAFYEHGWTEGDELTKVDNAYGRYAPRGCVQFRKSQNDEASSVFVTERTKHWTHYQISHHQAKVKGYEPHSAHNSAEVDRCSENKHDVWFTKTDCWKEEDLFKCKFYQ